MALQGWQKSHLEKQTWLSVAILLQGWAYQVLSALSGSNNLKKNSEIY